MAQGDIPTKAMVQVSPKDSFMLIDELNKKLDSLSDRISEIAARQGQIEQTFKDIQVSQEKLRNDLAQAISDAVAPTVDTKAKLDSVDNSITALRELGNI